VLAAASVVLKGGAAQAAPLTAVTSIVFDGTPQFDGDDKPRRRLRPEQRHRAVERRRDQPDRFSSDPLST